MAESLTGGLVGSRISSVPGASEWFRGSIVAYASEVKRKLLGVGDGPVVSEAAAREMAAGAAAALGADVGLALTGVAGPTEQDGQPVGTVWVGLAIDGASHAQQLRMVGGDRDQIRQIATISALDLLRRRLLERQGGLNRLFVAVWPSASLTGQLRAMDRPSRPGLRWTTEDQWHVTLRFLGEMATAGEEELRAGLARVAAQVSAVRGHRRSSPGRSAQGCGCSPWPGSTTWPTPIATATPDLGQPPPHRPYRGHLTLARARRPGLLRGLPEPPVLKQWTVDRHHAGAQPPGLDRSPLRRHRQVAAARESRLNETESSGTRSR